jgi:type IV secretion system protein VirD4
VLQLLTEAEELDEERRPTKGLRRTAAEMVLSQNFQIASLAGRFIKEGSREIDSIRSTAETATRWLLSAPMRADLSKNGIDWAELTKSPTTVFLILPAEDLDFHAVWLKLMVTCALNAIYRQGGRGRVVTLMMLSEFFALGHLKPVIAGMGQGAKYGVRLWPVLQDIGQLSRLYGQDGVGTFIGNSGCVFGFATGDPKTAEFMSLYSDEQATVSHLGKPGCNGHGAQELRRAARARVAAWKNSQPPEISWAGPEVRPIAAGSRLLPALFRESRMHASQTQAGPVSHE